MLRTKVKFCKFKKIKLLGFIDTGSLTWWFWSVEWSLGHYDDCLWICIWLSYISNTYVSRNMNYVTHFMRWNVWQNSRQLLLKHLNKLHKQQNTKHDIYKIVVATLCTYSNELNRFHHFRQRYSNLIHSTFFQVWYLSNLSLLCNQNYI